MEEARKTAVALLPGVISELLLVILLLLFPVPPNNDATCVSDHLSSSPFLGTAISSNTALLLYLLTSSQLALSRTLRSHPLLASPNTSSSSSASFSTSTSSSSSSSSSSSFRKRKRQPKSRSPPSTSSIPFPSSLAVLHNPDSYPSIFNMTSPTFEWLSGLLEPLLDCRDPAGSHLNLSAHLRLAIGLFRLATGSSYGDISSRFHVSLSTSKFCTKQLCRVLCTNFRFWLAFPSPCDILSVSSSFQTLGGGLPNCCGILSCTHFRRIEEEESITAQIVVDASSKILSIAAGYRGNKGDFQILKCSTFYKNITGGQLLNSSPVYLNGIGVPQYVIGNGAYPLLPWLMVPFEDPAPLSSEEDFNAVHESLSHPALRTIASLRKWGILSQPIEEETNLAVACIGACAILHNMLLMREDFSALSDGSEDYSYYYHSSPDAGASSLLEVSVAKSAFDIRNALAGSAKGHWP
ncbi:protein ALP1-like [Aristolochia californica]|uniref:protein ALP1-like n=1 Tax=Aristolochia californica TaxID=171875 RepID=UPI0035DF2643